MIFRFANVQLDTEQQAITVDGAITPVQPQVFDLIVCLIENKDKVVSKQELIDAVWDGRIVSDNALNSRINAARRVLGDDGETQAVIKTFARKGFRFVAELEPAQTGSRAFIAAGPEQSRDFGPSLAVLPFTNLSADPGNAFLADGLTEDVVTALSKLRGFFVTDRNTTFELKSETRDFRQIARDLGVRYFLQGSVQSVANRVRVSARLTDTETGKQLWSERYDRELTDIFSIQDELTENLVSHLSPELYAAEHARLKSRHPASLDAWECFVNALHHYSQQSQEGSQKAIELLELSIQKDPDYAQALGLYATILSWRTIQHWVAKEDAIEKARKAADRAVLMGTNDPWAFIGRGYVSIVSREGDAAIINYGRAVDLSPNFAYARALLGVSNGYAGNADIARTHIVKAIQLSPRDTFLDKFYLYLAVAEFQAGNYLEAAEASQRAIQIKPGHPSSHLFRTASLAMAGDIEQARTAVTEFQNLVPNASVSHFGKSVLYYRNEDRMRVAEGLKLAGLPD